MSMNKTPLKTLRRQQEKLLSISDDVEQIKHHFSVLSCKLGKEKLGLQNRNKFEKAMHAMVRQLATDRKRLAMSIRKREAVQFAEERPSGLDKIIADGLPVLPPLPFTPLKVRFPDEKDCYPDGE